MQITAMTFGPTSASTTLRGTGSEARGLDRKVYDAGSTELEDGGLGKLVRSEGDKATGDRVADQAYDNAGIVHEFFRTVLGRDSIDGKGMPITSVVHFGKDFSNAFWDGEKMVYGDGDGTDFAPLSGALDVVGHEMAHGITEHSARLTYHNQPGALNESFSDVFGELIEQWHENRAGFGTVDAAKGADWLIGEDVFTPGKAGDALRNMKAPGTAYAQDSQPAHMDDYQQLPDTRQGDWGGVHINSGIPNKAAYEVGIRLGGEKLAKIWYEALTTSLGTRSSFDDAAKATVAAAAKLYDDSASQAVSDAWKAVGILAPVGSSAPERRIDASAAAHDHTGGDGVVPPWLTTGRYDASKAPTA